MPLIVSRCTFLLELLACRHLVVLNHTYLWRFNDPLPRPSPTAPLPLPSPPPSWIGRGGTFKDEEGRLPTDGGVGTGRELGGILPVPLRLLLDSLGTNLCVGLPNCGGI